MPLKPKIKFVECRQNGWTSATPLSNGEFDYWLRIELIDFGESEEARSEVRHRYTVKLAVVAPSQLSESRLKEVAETACVVPCDVDIYDIAGHGFCAGLYSEDGNNKQKLIAAAKDFAQDVPRQFKCLMDKPQDDQGRNGWVYIRGDI